MTCVSYRAKLEQPDTENNLQYIKTYEDVCPVVWTIAAYLQKRRANRGAGLRSRVSIIDCCFTGTLVKVLNSLPDRTIAGRVVKGFNKTLATKLLGKDDFGATGVRFDTFTDGQSVIGTQFLQSFVRLRTSIDNPNEGILGSDNIECLGMDAKGVGELEHP